MSAPEINVNSTDINAVSSNAEKPLDVIALLFFAYRDFVGEADAILERQGFGRAHHRVLYFVTLDPGMTVADLLSILKITKQSLARVLRQLIDNGYIEQQTGETDRRQRLLFVTPKGAELVKQLTLLQTDRITKAMQPLDEEGQKAVRGFLTEMIQKTEMPTLERLGLTSWQK